MNLINSNNKGWMGKMELIKRQFNWDNLVRDSLD